MKNNTKLNLEFAGTECTFWATNGIIFNFAAVFLQYKGYSNYKLGIILAASNIVGFLLQPLIAGYIDRHNKKPLLKSVALVALLSLVSAIAAACIPSVCPLLSVAYVLVLATSILLQPLTNSMCKYLNTWGYEVKFARARAAGSLGFALCMVILGALTVSISPMVVPASYVIILAMLILIILLLMRQDKTIRLVPPKVFDNKAKAANPLPVFIRNNRRFCVYLIGIAMLFFSHSLLGNFMIEFLRPIGGNSGDMGNIFCIMALSELPAMLLFDRLLIRFRCSALIKISAVMFVVKQAAAWAASSVPMMYVAMCIQALSFAVFIPASVRYVDEVIKKRDSVKGQACTTSMFTLGSVFASYFGGYMLDTLSIPNTLMVGTIVAAAGALIIIPSVEKTKLAEQKKSTV